MSELKRLRSSKEETKPRAAKGAECLEGRKPSAVLHSGSDYLVMNNCNEFFLIFSFLESSFLVLTDIEMQESFFAHFVFVLYFPFSGTFRNFKTQKEILTSRS